MGGSVDASRASLRRYLQAVDRRYSAIRGVPAALTPRDVTLVMEWFERGVPLSLVLRTLDDLLASHQRGSTAGQPIRSLRFIRKGVEKAFRAHRLLAPQRATEAPGEFSATHIAGVLGAMATKLTESRWGERFPIESTAVAERLRSLAHDLPDPVPVVRIDDLEAELARIDEDVARRLAEHFPAETAVATEEARRALAAHASSMTESGYRAALTMRTEGELRRLLGIPRTALLFVEGER